MASGLVDSNVLIDLLRDYPPARIWIRTQQSIGITHVVYLELLQGAKDRMGERKAIKLLKEFEIVPLAFSDFEWAIEQMVRLHLSHNVTYEDCLIAAPAYRLQLPLYTQNVKHFTPILGALAQKPY